MKKSRISLLILAGSLIFAQHFLLPRDAAAAKPKPKKIAAKPAAKPSKAAAAADDGGPECRASLLMDAVSGDILKETNSHQALAPASMVKLMTIYVTLKRIHEGGIKLDDKVSVSAACSKVGGSQVYLRQGEEFSLGDLVQATMIQSANDAATAIAEYIGGSRDGFVEIMNDEAKALGMTESEFHSPHGLPAGKDQQPDLVSARDFALLARTLITKYPEVLEYSSKGESDFRDGEFKMANHNHLLKSFPGCDGLKTGYYAQAGFSITASAQRNGSRMIAVVMGCKQRKTRDEEAAKLMSLGFAQYRSVSLIEKGGSIGIAVPVAGGAKSSTTLAAASDLRVSLKSGEEKQIVKKPAFCDNLAAPMLSATPCGSVSFWLGDREIGKVDMVTTEDIPRAGMLGRLKENLGL